jgi:hypothetical protein
MRRDMSVTDKHFSEIFNDSLEVLAIVQALATRSGFTSLNELCEHDPDVVARHCDTALLAIRALKGLERKRS